MRTTGSWPRPGKTVWKDRFQSRSLSSDSESAYDLTGIADLNDRQIHRMTHEELERVVHATRSLFLNEHCSNRLSHFDQATLERLAFLARFCCQNQRARTQNSGNDRDARYFSQEK